jgi:hypothetical protein
MGYPVFTLFLTYEYSVHVCIRNNIEGSCHDIIGWGELVPMAINHFSRINLLSSLLLCNYVISAGIVLDLGVNACGRVLM